MALEAVSPSLLIMVATLLAAVSGVPLLISPLLSAVRAQQLSIVLMLTASCTGLAGSIMALASGATHLFQ